MQNFRWLAPDIPAWQKCFPFWQKSTAEGALQLCLGHAFKIFVHTKKLKTGLEFFLLRRIENLEITKRIRIVIMSVLPTFSHLVGVKRTLECHASQMEQKQQNRVHA